MFLKNAIKFNYEGGQVKNINEKHRENRVFDKFSEGAGCQIDVEKKLDAKKCEKVARDYFWKCLKNSFLKTQ